MTTLTHTANHDRQIAAWLSLCAAVIFGMIILGGVTRLTTEVFGYKIIVFLSEVVIDEL